MSFDIQKSAVRKDRSIKGSIDEEILPLIDAINSKKDYYTTSSCAGRIVVIEKQERKDQSRWLFTSHSPAGIIELASLKIGKHPVWFQLESPIIHVCCRDMDSGRKLIAAAKASGFKRATFYSIGRRIIVEVFGSEKMETIIADKGKALVSQDYMDRLVVEANKKMKSFRSKLDAFAEAISLP